MSDFWTVDAPRLAQIIWLDLLLSGDNAVVIALASRALPPSDRKRAAAFGSVAAIALRVLFAIVLLQLLRTPWLELVGGALLLWIAVRLTREQKAQDNIFAASSVWKAVRTIAFADAVMSIDNVLAITAAAHGRTWLVLFGLIVSLPLVVFGAAVFLRVLKSWPWLLMASGALVGWTGGQMAVSDSVLRGVTAPIPHIEIWAGAAGAVAVTVISTLWSRLRRR